MKTLYGKDSKGGLRVWSVWTEGGDVVVRHGQYPAGKMQEKRYATEGKNLGKSNETTPETQALLEMEAKYVKQLKTGYFKTTEEALESEEFTPMKAQNYKDHSHKVEYPCIEQVKLNGQRLMIDAQGVAWSKQGEPLELPKHWVGVKELAIAEGGLDGEVYAGLEAQGGLSLQKIIAAFRKPNADTPKLKYWVYDLPLKGVTQEARHYRLSHLREDQQEDTRLNPNVVFCPGVIVKSEFDGDQVYDLAVSQKYEGVVYRKLSGLYEFGKRSYFLIKRKPRQTAEARVLSTEIDRNGWGILNCLTLDGAEFKCQMRVDVGSKNYRLYENSKELIGSFIEYEYEELSDAGIPTKPSGVGIRLVDSLGRPLV